MTQAWSHPHSSNLLNDGWLTSFYGGGKSVGGTSLSINCLSSSSIDNLMNADFTAEGWFLSAQNATLRTFFEKNNGAAVGWKFELSTTGRVNALVYGSTTSANYNPAGDVSDGRWHHWAMTFTGAGTKVIAVYKDGVLLGSSSALVGSTVSDAANSLKLSSSTGGQVGWARISNIIRYTANFAPVRVPPSADANTLGQWNMAEGTGTTLANVGTVGSAADGTITNGVWALNNWTDVGTSGDNVSVAFNGTSTSINAGNHASVNNLADNILTAELYFMNDGPLSTTHYMLDKGHSQTSGWGLYISSSNLITARVYCATTSAAITYTIVRDGKWHHASMSFNDAGDRKVRLFYDGILVGTSSAGVGAILADNVSSLIIGNSSTSTKGNIGWIRISDSDRYGTSNFIPPARNNPPANDANTVRLFKLNEGTGTTIVDYSTNAQNATLANGTWNHTRDMATDSPGARVYNWGNVINAPAAGDGIKQILSGTAGSDYVIRALAYSEDSIGQPKLEVYDETNGAVINSITAWGQQDNEVINGTFDTDTDWTKGTGWTIAGGVAHSAGAVGSNNLQNTTVSLRTAGKYYLLGATVSNYVSGTLVLYAEGIAQIPTISGNGSYQGIVMATQPSSVYVQARTFTGDVDNVFCMAIPDEQHPKPVQLSFELPTIARNGSAADCVSYSVRLLSATAGVVGFNQCELYTNAIDNPGLDAGAAADPFIPYGFTNSSLQAGNSTLESTVVHSAGKSLAYSSGFYSRGIYNSPVPATGNFYAVGFFGFGEGSAGPSLSATSADSISALLQYSTSATTVSTSTKLWKHAKAVYRALNSSKRNYFMGGTGNTGIRYLDDVYAINLDAVSLTSTPASSANSIEGTGIRVDGRDNVYQTVTPVGILTASKGRIKFIVTPRHSSTTAPSFGNTSRTWLQLYGDANNQIVVSEGATLLTLTVITGGVTYSNTGTKPVITAGSNYIVDMTYVSDKAYVSFNGAKVVTTSANISFATVPTALYASRSTNQIDAVFSAP